MFAAQRPWLALLVIFGSQVLISFVPAIAPVIAAEMAPRLGVNPDRIGIFSALTYGWAIIGGLLVAPWITWLGPVRSIQIMLLAAGLAALMAAQGTMVSVLLAALVLGVSLGFPHPAFTSILGRHAPQRSMGLFLSLRFAAAPVGIAMAGLLVPASVAAIGVHGTIAAAAAACALAALAVGRAVRLLDWRNGERPQRIDAGASIREVLAHPALRRLSLVCMVFAMVQQGFLAYAVLFLVGLGLPLHTAAALLAMSQVISVIGRIAIGHASDRWVAPRVMLVFYGVGMGAASMALAMLPASPSLLLAASVMGLVAATAMGWPGMMAAQLLRLTAPERVAITASGTQVFMFSGAVLGPYLIATLLSHGVGYTPAFIGLGLLAMLAGLSMLTHGPSRGTDRPRAVEERLR